MQAHRTFLYRGLEHPPERGQVAQDTRVHKVHHRIKLGQVVLQRDTSRINGVTDSNRSNMFR